MPPVRSAVALFRRRVVPPPSALWSALWSDEAGGEVIEYALTLGLIAVACIVMIGAFGTKVLARWTSVNSSM